MTQQEFYEFQTNVEAAAVGYVNLSDGRAIVTCADGVRILVDTDGSSRIFGADSDGQ